MDDRAADVAEEIPIDAEDRNTAGSEGGEIGMDSTD